MIKAVDEQLAARGWTRVDKGGDASISAVGSTRSEQTLDTFFNGGFGGGARRATPSLPSSTPNTARCTSIFSTRKPRKSSGTESRPMP